MPERPQKKKNLVTRYMARGYNIQPVTRKTRKACQNAKKTPNRKWRVRKSEVQVPVF